MLLELTTLFSINNHKVHTKNFLSANILFIVQEKSWFATPYQKLFAPYNLHKL